MKASGSVRLQRPGTTAALLSYDAQGHLVKVLELDQNNQPTIETDYAYDNRSNLITITQHGTPGDAPRIRTFTYDQYSDLLSITSPEGGTVTYTYNHEGRLASKTDARGIATSYIWNTQGRLAGKQYSNGAPSVVYVYANDNSRKIIGSYLDAPEGHKAERAYHYNAQGKLDQLTQMGKSNYTISLGYDAQGRINQITYPDGRTIQQIWSKTNQLSSITGPDGSLYFTGTSYSLSGDLEGSILGNDIAVQNDYSKRGQLTALAVKHGNQQLLDKSYVYTASGSISDITDALDPSNNSGYQYDNLHRIVEAGQPSGGFSQSFRYDAFGNLQQEGNFPFESSYNARNRITATADLTYDADGELTFDGLHHYHYNAEGRIVDVDNGDIRYLYSAEGDRVEKNVRGAVTEEVWFGDELLSERNPDGNWTDYIYANGQRIGKTQSNQTSYYIADPLGMTRMEISSAGQVLAKGEFAPFGQMLTKNSETAAQTVPFTGGEQHDPETGLDSYKYRSYNPSLGRWMSPDPSGERYANLRNPQSLNLYTYVLNDPLKYVDVLGLDACSDDCSTTPDPVGSGDDCGSGDEPPCPIGAPDGGGGGGGTITAPPTTVTVTADPDPDPDPVDPDPVTVVITEPEPNGGTTSVSVPVSLVP